VKKKSALGRGLESLLPDLDGRLSEDGIPATVLIDLIDPNPFQPRIDWDEEELASLAESIREQGILQPLVLRRYEKRYQLIAGERRLRASKLAGIESVPAYIREADDKQMMVWALMENIQRQDLNPMEKAEGFSRICSVFSVTQEELGKLIGISRSAVVNYQRLMELPDSVKVMVRSRKLSMGHGRALLGLDGEETIVRMAKLCIARGYSVRAIEDEVRKASKKTSVKRKAKQVLPEIKQLESELQRILGTRVFMKDSGGRGKLEIEYSSLDELDRILSIIRRRGDPV
jgi:ParB family chromosome partitioning protein